MLLSTGNQVLIEHSNDRYWGDGLDGTGQNKLGKILMEVRDKLISLQNQIIGKNCNFKLFQSK